MTISFSLTGVLQFILYIVLFAAMIAAMVFITKAVVKMNAVSRSIEDAEDTVRDIRKKFERADEMAGGVKGSADSIIAELKGDGSAKSKVMNVTSEVKNIKTSIDGFRATSDTE